MTSLAIKEMHDAKENVREQQLTGGDGAWEVPKKKRLDKKESLCLNLDS